MARIGLLIIATWKYDVFLKPLLDSVNKHFFKNEDVDVYIFSDKPLEFNYERLKIQVLSIKHYPFPYATLYRYKHFNAFKNVLTSDYLFYLDADMLIVDEIDDEVLPDSSGLIATIHPGFFRGGGSWCKNKKSLAYTKYPKKYYAGGFQGGERNMYIKVCEILKTLIDTDENNGIMAEWHDESFWNYWLSISLFKEISPSYCYPESWTLPFKKKILALDKNHAEMRK